MVGFAPEKFETSVTHQTSRAQSIPGHPLLVKTHSQLSYSLLANAEITGCFFQN